MNKNEKLVISLIEDLIKNYDDSQADELYNTFKEISNFSNLIDALESIYNKKNDELSGVSVRASKMISLLVHDKSTREALINLDFTSFESDMIKNLYSRISLIDNFLLIDLFKDGYENTPEDISHIKKFDNDFIEKLSKTDFINVIKESALKDQDFEHRFNSVLKNLIGGDDEKTNKISKKALTGTFAEARSYFISFFQNLEEEEFFQWRKKILSSGDVNSDKSLEVMIEMKESINERSIVFASDNNSNPFRIDKETKSVSFVKGTSGKVDVFQGSANGFQGRSVTSSADEGFEGDQLFRHPAKIFLINSIVDIYIKDNNLTTTSTPKLNGHFIFLKSLIDKKDKNDDEINLLKDINSIVNQKSAETYEAFKNSVRETFFYGKVTEKEVKDLFSNGAIDFFFDQYSTSITKPKLNAIENQALAFAYIQGQKSIYKLNIDNNAVDLLFDCIDMEFLHIDKLDNNTANVFLNTLANDFFELMNNSHILNSSDMLNELAQSKGYSELFLKEFLFNVGFNRDYMSAIFAQKAKDNEIDTNFEWINRFEQLIASSAGGAYLKIRESLFEFSGKINAKNEAQESKSKLQESEKRTQESENKRLETQYIMDIVEIIADNVNLDIEDLRKTVKVKDINSFSSFRSLVKDKYSQEYISLCNNTEFLTLLESLDKKEYLYALFLVNITEFLKKMSKNDVLFSEIDISENLQIVNSLCEALVNNIDIDTKTKKALISKIKSDPYISEDEFINILKEFGVSKKTIEKVDKLLKIFYEENVFKKHKKHSLDR